MVYKNNEILRGNFYPLMHMEKVESGELAYGTPHAIMREVEWHTDHLGFRKKEPYAREIEVVVVGDSNIVGTSLTQSDMFSEVLEERINVGVYPLAPVTPYGYLITPEFQIKPAKVLIWGIIERHLWDQVVARFVGTKPKPGVTIPETPPAWRRALAIRNDHFFHKRPMLNFFKARLDESLKFDTRSSAKNWNKGHPFILNEVANNPVPNEKIEKAAQAIKQCSDHFRSIGTQFIFLPIPNKENTYYDLLPSKTKPPYLSKLIERLRELGVDVVDTVKAYDNFREKNPETHLYDPDETHWNATGVRVSVEALMDLGVMRG